MTPEGKLKEQVKGYLRSVDAYFFMPVQMGLGAATVDFLCCVQGRFIAIETKVWPRKATPLQLHTLQKVKDAGGIAFVAYDMDAVYANLKGLFS